MKEPQLVTLEDLFVGPHRYKAPVFQRLYVWGQKELTDLLQDIDGLNSNGDGQFLGAIVLQDLGKIAGAASPTEYLIVDGQQRLTTLFLFLLAIAHLDRVQGSGQLTEYILQRYMAEATGKYKGWPKLIPTAQDRLQLWELLKDHSSEVAWDFHFDPATPGSRKSIDQQWKRLLKYLENLLANRNSATLKQELLDSLLEAVAQRLSFVQITLDREEDPAEIFSKLNARGQPLSLADLVRNEVFSHYKDPGIADKFYKSHWLPFEKSFGDDASLGSFFTQYAYILFEGRVTKAAAFPRLQRRWREHSLTPSEILKDLQKYAPYFQLLSGSAQSATLLSAKELAWVDRFARMPRTTVVWPFLINLLRGIDVGKLSQDDGLQCLRIVEAFLVRRAIMGWEPTGLHAVYKTLWPNSLGDPSEVVQRVQTRTIQVPSDAELTEALSRDFVDTRAVLPYLFQEYERDIIRTKKFDPPLTNISTIEHVLPKEFKKHWKNAVSVDQHAALIGTLGNLAPLSEAQNKSLQNQPWPAKRARYKGSNWKMTQALAEHTQWTADVIRSRNAQLSAWFIQRWPELSSLID